MSLNNEAINGPFFFKKKTFEQLIYIDQEITPSNY